MSSFPPTLGPCGPRTPTWSEGASFFFLRVVVVCDRVQSTLSRNSPYFACIPWSSESNAADSLRRSLMRASFRAFRLDMAAERDFIRSISRDTDDNSFNAADFAEVCCLSCIMSVSICSVNTSTCSLDLATSLSALPRNSRSVRALSASFDTLAFRSPSLLLSADTPSSCACNSTTRLSRFLLRCFSVASLLSNFWTLGMSC